MHDCGKLATPDSVLDKSTKLHTLWDRIDSVRARFAVLKAQRENDMLRALLAQPEKKSELAIALQAQLAQLDDDLLFIEKSNKGGEFMASAHQDRVREIAEHQWRDASGQMQPLLNEDEVYKLCIERGTITHEERQVINNHMQVTIDMLESLPFPRKLRRVPEYAGGHHEKMDGTGFPKGLTREQMSLPARMMAIADIFEALTASDRPYKQAMTLSEALRILGRMKEQNHIDPDLFAVFIREKVYLEYAREFLQPAQIDEVDEAWLLESTATLN